MCDCFGDKLFRATCVAEAVNESHELAFVVSLIVFLTVSFLEGPLQPLNAISRGVCIDVETAEAEQRIEVQACVSQIGYICKCFRCFFEDCQDRFELACIEELANVTRLFDCLLYTSPSPRDS